MNSVIIIAILISLIVVLTGIVSSRREDDKEIPYATLIKMDLIKPAKPRKIKVRFNKVEMEIRADR